MPVTASYQGGLVGDSCHGLATVLECAKCLSKVQ